ncbi:hypothetical protein BDN67DRAFT_969659 [Paxillus ammoniavirescens]|nr:hypothetical protein BDN67DRAFT_969659 [Paxillus ammoniavirescens]
MNSWFLLLSWALFCSFLATQVYDGRRRGRGSWVLNSSSRSVSVLFPLRLDPEVDLGFNPNRWISVSGAHVQNRWGRVDEFKIPDKRDIMELSQHRSYHQTRASNTLS